MKKLLELRQQKAALKTQMRSMLDKADSEKRSLNEEEGKKFDELRAQADALEVEINRLEAVADDQRNLPGTSVEGEPVSNDELRHYIMTGDTRSLSTLVQADGGYTVIPELDKEIMRQLQDDSVMRSIATVKTTKTNEYQKLVSVGGTTVNRGTEGEARTGLRFELTPPNTQLGNDVLELVERGDISGMSFGFRALKEAWDIGQSPYLRTVTAAELREITVTSMPAYPESGVEIAHRSLFSQYPELRRAGDNRRRWAELAGL
ncbi:phage major capsid protein [Cronobacter sakazakii]|nr:phage major capsid protein [Cronobacter sakazakii]NHV94417.1 phage major capsid protein [Cronobacter sakazakii]PPY09681.1 phage major capsid protein [Cronobacter sakazakii]PQV66688.1 phage major capsid protein [Cronobacter sakazakii]PQV84293.1 phage major capsid protein [Cronobacter sakazakii]